MRACAKGCVLCVCIFVFKDTNTDSDQRRLSMVIDLDNLVRLSKVQIKPAAETFARALQNDPLFNYFISDHSERKALSHALQLMTRFGVMYGEVYATSPNLEAVAVWFPSEKAKMTLWKMIRIGELSLIPFYFKFGKVISRMMSYNEYAFKVHDHHAPFRHWYLFLIGVDPSFQGKGCASRLLKPMLARIDQEHFPCYLETQNEENVPVYEHFGFKVVEEDTIPRTDVNHWGMLREKSD